MVSGTQWPGGDPFLRQQNEPSIAVSTRNPLHLLAGANDYRSVDIPFTAPPRPDEEETGDAWLGVFKSVDGGSRWTSTLLDGYPQQNSLTSPLTGYQAAADPVVRAGNNGMFYYAGIVLNRGTNPLSGVFVSRFIDNNNKENGDPIAFIDTKMVDHGTSGQFIDKPWVSVSPTAGIGQCSVAGQTFAAQTIYLAYSVFVGNDNNIRSKIVFTKSTDCGNTWATVQKLSETYSINQGVSIAVDPTNANNVYVIWRRFHTATDPDSLIFAKSTNGGSTFTKGVVIANITPFEEGTGAAQIRTNAYPTSAVDGSGRLHVAWSQRDANGDGRIVLMTTSDGGTTWSALRQIDNPGVRGHEFMPAMTFAAGKLTLAWYDLRLDHTIGQYKVNAATHLYGDEQRVPLGNLAAGSFYDPGAVFWSSIADYSPTPTPLKRRHTLDVRVAEFDPSSPSLYAATARATRYKVGTISLNDPYDVHDLQANPPDLPMFRQGTVPFIGDYIDVAAYQNPTSGATTTVPSRIRHVVWTDNRDVHAPAGTPPDWTKYTPPNGGASNQSVFDKTQNEQPCTATDAPFVASRNQNIYTTRVTDGLFAGSPGNAKPLGSIRRAFTVFVQNARSTTANYRLTIAQQPPAPYSASFLQFSFLDHVDVAIPAHSSATRSVFVNAPAHTRVDVNVREITQTGASGTEVVNGLSTVVALNPDIINPDIINPDIINPDIINPDIINSEVFNPDIINPDIINPDIINPDIINPDIINPDIINPDIINPDIVNSGFTNPDIINPDIINPDIINPDIINPDIINPDIINGSATDTSWPTTNRGNTTGGFTVKLLKTADLPSGVKAQLILTKTYDTPAARGCNLGVEHTRQVVANITNPSFTPVANAGTLGDPLLNNSSSNNATLWLAPGEVGRITLRLAGHAPGVVLDASQYVTPVVVAQSVNTADAGNPNATPAISLTMITASLPDASIGQNYSATLSAIGGTAPYTWTTTGLPSALTVNGSSISGAPQSAGTFPITLTVVDSATPPHTRTRNVSLTVRGPQTFFVTNTSDSGAGSLRQAILDANANNGFKDTIRFNIAGAAPHVIAPASALPTVNDPVVLDGTANGACDGSSPAIEIDGQNLAANGLNIAAGPTTVRGVSITRFGLNGISITAGSGSTVQCSYIGLSTDGVTGKGNAQNGIYIIGSGNNLIGGPGAARNVISGNNGEGIRIDDALATQNTIQGNYIGTNASGTAAVGNRASGVYLRRASNNSVDGNVISGNTGFAGVAICGNTTFCGGGNTSGPTATGNTVTGNLIGTDASNTSPIPNLGYGVSIDSSANNTIGGAGSLRNVIAASGSAAAPQPGVYLFGASPDGNSVIGNQIGRTATLGNTGGGVVIATGSNNTIGTDAAPNLIYYNHGAAAITLAAAAGTGNVLRSNNIDFNDGIGIDLGGDGPTANDPGDTDSGPNGTQNYPVINSVLQEITNTANVVSVDGSLQTTPNTQVVIDFYWSHTCDQAQQGQYRFGSITRTTDANGNVNFSQTFNVQFSAASVTALATTVQGNNTSEFSPCVNGRTVQTLSVATNALPDAFEAGGQNAAYNVSLTSAGGVPPISWSIVNGSLPGGLGMDGALIAGFPTEVTYHPIVFRATDALGFTADKALAIQTWAPPSAYCVAGTFPLFNNTNFAGVSTNATTPTIVAQGRPNGYTLKSLATYHSLASYIVQPTLGLAGPNTIGPFGVILVPNGQGFQNWQVDQVPNSPVLNGNYTVTDSDASTWAYNAQSGNTGFTQVCVVPNP